MVVGPTYLCESFQFRPFDIVEHCLQYAGADRVLSCQSGEVRLSRVADDGWRLQPEMEVFIGVTPTVTLLDFHLGNPQGKLYPWHYERYVFHSKK